MNKIKNEMLDFYKQLELTQEQYRILEIVFYDNDNEHRLDRLLSMNLEDSDDWL